MNKKLVFVCLIEVVIAALMYYLFLPAINPTSIGFWIYLITLMFIFAGMASIALITNSNIKVMNKLRDVPKIIVFPLITSCLIVFGIILINIIVSPMFMAKSFSKRIVVNETGNFAEDITEVDFNKVPLLDRDSALKLGDRVMGQYSDYVSQFYVSEEYTQINYNEDILRVTPIEYGGLIKWISNRKNGIGAYITVNSVTGEAKLIKIDKGMRYLKSAFLNDNLNRRLRFKYPFDIFGEAKFEIDNDGNPYYIVPILKYTGVNNKTRVAGAIVFDPVTGSSKKYNLKDIPTWVDNVYPVDLILEQVNDWGTYRNGFLNSIFGQRNVVNTTEGYNYLALNDDIYLYTGITSVLADESNLGFILTNLRTGETTFYDVPGAEEYSAMDSAEGQVQQMHYKSTFPLLININGNPTYLVSLKDNAGLVKMYGFVDVRDYQKVSVTDSSLGINKALDNYLNTNINDVKEDKLISKEITVSKITNAVSDGNTYYYIVDTNNQKYIASIKVSNILPFINSGDNITVKYYKEQNIIEIKKIN